MAVDYTTTVLQCAPTAAAGTSVTPSALDGGTGNWFEIHAATPTAWLLAGIELLPEQVASVFYAVRFIVDIGVGAAAAETVIASFPGSWVSTGGSASFTQYVLPLLIDAIPASSRVVARVRRWDATSTGAWKVKVLYYAKPLVGSVVTTVNAPKVYPIGAPSVTLVGALGVWTNGTYVSLVASTATAVVLLGAVIFDSGNGNSSETDIAVGAASAEVVIATLHYFQSTQPSSPGFCAFGTPLDLVPIGSRISARTRGDSGTVTVKLALLYVEKPL